MQISNSQSVCKFSIFISCHESTLQLASALSLKLKALFNVDVVINEKQLLENCNALIAFVNENYAASSECMDHLTCFSSSAKPILRLNLKPEIILKLKQRFNTTMIQLYDDENNNLCEDRMSYVKVVNYLLEILPNSSFSSKKQNDLLIVVSQNFKNKVQSIPKQLKVLYSCSSEAFEPNFEEVRDSKVVLVILDHEINECPKSIEEIRFASKIGTELIIVEDSDIERLDSNLKEIINTTSNENIFLGFHHIDSRNMKKLKNVTLKVIHKIKIKLDLECGTDNLLKVIYLIFCSFFLFM